MLEIEGATRLGCGLAAEPTSSKPDHPPDEPHHGWIAAGRAVHACSAVPPIAAGAGDAEIAVTGRLRAVADPGRVAVTGMMGWADFAYRRDVRTGFLPVPAALARSDLLNECIRHVGSAAFAVPPGVPDPGGFIGQGLLG